MEKRAKKNSNISPEGTKQALKHDEVVVFGDADDEYEYELEDMGFVDYENEEQDSEQIEQEWI
jgi:hypothetical protein